MKIVPSQTELKKWSLTFPKRGDLVFLDSESKKRLSSFPFPILTVDEVRDQNIELWTLNDRSWYGYSLNKADYCTWLPAGALEKSEGSIQQILAKVQIKLGVPTLLKSNLLTSQLNSKLLVCGKHYWLSSAAWKKLSSLEKIEVIRAWFKQNEIFTYKSVSYKELPQTSSKEIRKLGLKQVLNHYPSQSGPNCLAATAGAISSNFKKDIANQWMIVEPFLRYLKEKGFSETKVSQPLLGDVLLFYRKKQLVHSAYCIGDGFYFEKPGQDFYEPYRIEFFNNWKKEWPQCRLSIWRR